MSDIIERLQHSADTQYLMSGSADEMLHDAISEIRKLRAEVEGLRAEVERLRDVLRRVVVYPSGDRAARVAFVSVGCQVSFPLHPQTTWALELLVEFDQARRKALEGKP